MSDIYEYQFHRDNMTELMVRTVNNNRCVPNFHRNYEVIFMLEGEMTGTINHQSYVFKKGDIVFIPSYHFHVFQTPTQSRVTIIIIPYDYAIDFNNLLQDKTLPYHMFDTAFNMHWLPLWKEIVLYVSNSQHLRLTNKGFVDMLIGTLIEHYGLVRMSEKKGQSIIIELLDYIEKHYTESITNTRLAAAFGYNKTYISRIFNLYVPIGLNNYINNLRIRQIIQLARLNESNNILNLALDNGFSSLTSFYRAFQNLYHMSPKKYLNTIDYPPPKRHE